MKHTISTDGSIKYELTIYLNSFNCGMIKLEELDNSDSLTGVCLFNGNNARNVLNSSMSHIAISDENTHWELNHINVAKLNGVILDKLEIDGNSATNSQKVKYISDQIEAILLL